ncbi:MAG: hypothetical protein RLZZ159_1126 [Actinomycetota bacterium]|jgi:hypothetical protein
MALERQAHVLDMQRLLDRWRKQPWRRSHELCGGGRARHLDGKTSQLEGIGKHPHTATPNLKLPASEDAMFQTWVNHTIAP